MRAINVSSALYVPGDGASTMRLHKDQHTTMGSTTRRGEYTAAAARICASVAQLLSVLLAAELNTSSNSTASPCRLWAHLSLTDWSR